MMRTATLLSFRHLSLFIWLLLPAVAVAQLGGLTTYQLLNLSPSARISGLGGVLIAVADDDVNLAATNPAVLNASMHQQVSFSHAFHPGDIDHGYVAFGWHQPRWNMSLHGGLQYVSYGTFERADEQFQDLGTFKAAEYALTLGAARTFEDRFSLGANLKLITSQLESYQSLGGVLDLAALYQDTASRFVVTVVARNLGTQFTTYAGQSEPLPFELQVGISKRLRYLPFRFSLTYRYLDRWNVRYDDPNRDDESIFIGEEVREAGRTSIWLDNFFRHLVFSGELLVGKQENFRLRVGYSHLLRQELTVGDYRSLAGIALGMGIKINRFRLEYGRTAFHLGGGVNQLSIATNLREFRSGE